MVYRRRSAGFEVIFPQIRGFYGPEIVKLLIHKGINALIQKGIGVASGLIEYRVVKFYLEVSRNTVERENSVGQAGVVRRRLYQCPRPGRRKSLAMDGSGAI